MTDYIKLAQKAGFNTDNMTAFSDLLRTRLETFAQLVREDAMEEEREHCALVVEEDLIAVPFKEYHSQYNEGVKRLARKIRQRG